MQEKHGIHPKKAAKRRRKPKPALWEIPEWMLKRECPRKKQYLSGPRILPRNMTGREGIEELVERVFLAYNAGRLREACRLFTEKMLDEKTTVGMSLAGALTPAGLGASVIVPLIRAGFVDWIVSTGANLYHDLHFALNFSLHRGSHRLDDADLLANDVVRIYDVLLSQTDCILRTDEALIPVLMRQEFQHEMGTAEFHHLLGRHAAEWERRRGVRNVSILAAAWRAGVPVFTSSPGDSAIGMNMAALDLMGCKLRINPSVDVNESTAIVLGAKRRRGGRSGVLLVGGGSPKNFLLQTEPQIQEILRIPEAGHDYFVQLTDARPDTGGLSGATPQEAVSWGKVDPARVQDSIVCYLDATVALPILAHYALARRRPRRTRRLYDQREKLTRAVVREFFAHNRGLPMDQRGVARSVDPQSLKRRRKAAPPKKRKRRAKRAAR